MLHSELKKAPKRSKTIELSSQMSRFDAACPVVTGSSMQLKHDRFELWVTYSFKKLNSTSLPNLHKLQNKNICVLVHRHIGYKNNAPQTQY